MDYEKLHKDTINRLQQMVSCGKITVEVARGICADFEPESEDERMKNYIISCLDNQLFTDGSQADIDRKNAIAWLEKQGKQETLCDKCRKEHPSHSCQDITELGRCAVEHEHKPADEVKTRFEIGDLITNGILVGKIDEIHEWGYHAYFGDHYADVPDVENWHKWTIQDAKDGDILAAHECYVIFKEIDGLNIKCYCTYHYLGSNPSFYVDTLQNKDAFYPATKEQCDQLKKAMADVGYTFDFEKKELKKIEQKPLQWNISDYRTWQYIVCDVLTKHNGIGQYLDNGSCKEIAKYMQEEWSKKLCLILHTSWSKEDEEKLLCICEWIKDYPRIADFKDEMYTVKTMYTVANNYINWLKSLKDRVQSKQE